MIIVLFIWINQEGYVISFDLDKVFLMQKDDVLKEVLKRKNRIIGCDKYIHAAVLVPLVNINGEDSILFQRRAENISQAGEICFPGGCYEKEKDSSFQETALRETSEELGIPDHNIKVIGKIGTVVASMGVLIEVYAGRLLITGIDDLKVDLREVAEVFLVPLQELREKKIDKFHVKVKHDPFDKGELIFPARSLRLPERYYKMWGGRKQRVLAFQTNHGTVWGITAEISRCFIKVLSTVSF